MREGDVYKTFASTEKLNKDYGYQPKVTIKEGVSLFVDWYKSYYKNV
jgi:UDP-glucuronate 4-epimerase